MKFIYLLILITLVSTQNVFECIITNKKIVGQALEVFETLKTKDFGKILNALIQAYFEVKDDVLACFEEEPTLKVIDCCYKFWDNDELYKRCQEDVQKKHIVC